MTLLAQSLERFRPQTFARLAAMRIVAFRAGFLLHGLVGKRAGLELVTKKTKAAALPCSLEEVLRCVTIGVASGTAAGSQGCVQDRETGDFRMAIPCRAVLRRRGRTLFRVRLCGGNACGTNQQQKKNYRRNTENTERQLSDERQFRDTRGLFRGYSFDHDDT
jgi:hypothetical protein